MSDFQANSPETIWLPEFGGSWLRIVIANQIEQMHTNANTRNLKVTRGWRILLRLAALVQMCQLRRSAKKAVTKRGALVGTLIQDPQGTHVPVSLLSVVRWWFATSAARADEDPGPDDVDDVSTQSLRVRGSYTRTTFPYKVLLYPNAHHGTSTRNKTVAGRYDHCHACHAARSTSSDKITATEKVTAFQTPAVPMQEPVARIILIRKNNTAMAFSDSHDTADPIHKIRPRANRTHGTAVQPCHVSRNGRHGNQRKVTWQKVTKEWKTGDKYDKDNEKLTMVKTWQQMGKKGVWYSTVS